MLLCLASNPHTMKFSQRSYQPELLDCDNIPFEDIKRNMRELDFINAYLGGHNSTIAGIKNLLKQNNGEIVICEIGCGGGNNLAAINKWCTRHNVKATFIGIDKNEYCIAYAQEKNTKVNCKWITSDYATVTFNNKPGIIFSSLFCHHFNEIQLQEMLQWMNQNSTLGFFINDLHRHAIAYYSIKVLTNIFFASYLVKNDAPLSVSRGFSRKEIVSLLQKTNLQNAKIYWKWAFRWLIVINSKS